MELVLQTLDLLKNWISLISRQDLYIKIGLLGKSPQGKLQINQFLSVSKQKYYEIIKAIYYNQESKYSYLSFEQINNNDKLIGYVRDIIK